jgi:hypothetical protein
MVGDLRLKSSGFPRYSLVMNAILAPLNIAKTLSLSVPPSQINANGYPTSALSSDVGSQGSIPGNYYGSYVWSWNGAASMYANGSPAIVYSFTNCTIPGLTNNCVSNNFTITNATAGVNPRVVFRYGLLITGVSGGNGSPVVLTVALTNFALGATVNVKLQVGVSSNLANGPNSDGSWTLSAGGGGTNTITLASSTGVISPTITGSGGPGVQSEVVMENSSVALYIKSGGTISGFSNLVYCQAANESAIMSGQLVDPAYVAQLKQLGVKWLRMMDVSGVQGSWDTDFTARVPSSYIDWPGGYFNTNYWVGTIHNAGSDVYTCSAPPLTNTGPYHNGEIVQGTIDITNSGGTPTLNVNGRGAKKIIGYVYPQTTAPFINNIPSAASAAGQTMQYTFTASWLNGGTPYVFTYTTTASGHGGSDLASAGILLGNVEYAMQQDATLNGKITAQQSGNIYPLTPQRGALTISYSGTPTCTIITLPASTLTASGNATFCYSYLLDAWMYRPGGMIQSVPLEYIVQLCNQVGASLWYTWPINTSSAYVTAFTNYIAANLNSDLKFATEVGNEMWNFGLATWAPSFTYGYAMGFSQVARYQNGASYGYTFLRTKQYATSSIAAWTASRSRSQHYILGMSATWDVANTDSAGWNGSQLDASANTTYGSYGGVDGIAGSTNAEVSHTASPNRPIDVMDGIGMAPYWGSDFLGGDYGTNAGGQTATFTSTTLANDPIFVAANKWAGGNTSGAYNDLYSQFYTPIVLSGPAGGINLLRSYKNTYNFQIESVCRKYDAGRIRPLAVLHYEGGPQFGVGNINNGTNDATTDIPNVTTALTNGGFSLGSYANASTASAMATAICGMVYNFKFSTQFYNLYRNYMIDLTTVHSGRECCGSQYGYSHNQWGLFPGSWAAGVSTAYSSYQAINDFDGGV